MCGIVGYIGFRNAKDVLIQGLESLEYRGYDSAGIAILDEDNIIIEKAEGKLQNLKNKLNNIKLEGTSGIGHTRWATHGIPTDYNAHPHIDCKGEFVVVHNGIIENFLELKKELLKKGHKFISDTDTEVIAHLIEEYYENDLEFAVKMAVNHLDGAYALGIISKKEPDKLIAVKKGSPLVLGVGDKENFIASDIPALLSYTDKVIYLDEGEVAVLTQNEVKITTLKNTPVFKRLNTIEMDKESAQKGGFPHFMLKEIYEQPSVITDTLRGRINERDWSVNLDEIGLSKAEIKKINHINFVACGTAYHAGLMGKYFMEELAHIHSSCDVASEFRYRNLIIDKEKDFTILISQSGETADTIAVMRKVQSESGRLMGIVNVVGSTIAREIGRVLYTRAGIEIGVAATKSFITQLTAVFLLSIYFGKIRGSITLEKEQKLLKELFHLPQLIDKYLELNSTKIKDIIEKYTNAKSCLFLGRHYNYPISLEGALKLKEISYIHAEGYPAGEMKHGPIALIDPEVPTVAIATNSFIYPKTISNILEVIARKGKVIAIVTEGNEEIKDQVEDIIYVPQTSEEIAPFLNTLPIQLIAYYAADLKGCNVDKPRNLAKSVTVE
jgi:glucosamine--fructose-6-phosphate aminotransferase (isomerizing)